MKADPKKLVAYYRVSTKKQGESGLGEEAQKAAVVEHAKREGGRIVAEYREVESGKRSDRRELAAAVAKARAIGGTLVIAKLDRLSRNVAFTSALMESGVSFVCCDNPTANNLTIHIYAAIAQDEAEKISDRTKRALAAAKVRGVKLGMDRRGHTIDWRKGQRKGLGKAVAAAAHKRRRKRNDAYWFLMGEIESMREEGLSYAVIAERLNKAEHVTSSGAAFAAMTVKRLLDAADTIERSPKLMYA